MRGTSYEVPGAKYQVPGTWYRVRFQVPGTYLVPGTWNQVPGTRYRVLVPGTWYHVPGTWYQVPGTRLGKRILAILGHPGDLVCFLAVNLTVYESIVSERMCS